MSMPRDTFLPPPSYKNRARSGPCETRSQSTSGESAGDIRREPVDSAPRPRTGQIFQFVCSTSRLLDAGGPPPPGPRSRFPLRVRGGAVPRLDRRPRPPLRAERVLGAEASVWHKEHSAARRTPAAVLLPGGFSYGDYLRCGAMARFSPIMGAVERFADAGGLVLGICNGFQILCEAGLLPGALVRNRDLTSSASRQRAGRGRARAVHLAAAAGQRAAAARQARRGPYYAPPRARRARARGPDRPPLRRAAGRVTPAGESRTAPSRHRRRAQRARNVVGLMPHPEHAVEPARRRRGRLHAPRARSRDCVRGAAAPVSRAAPSRASITRSRASTGSPRRVRADRADPRPRADLPGARDLLGDVVGALLVQVARVPARLPTTGRAGVAGPGRERGRGRDRRRARRGVQDREPQPPVVRRAVPGRGDRGRRHPARHLHDGRAADRQLDSLRFGPLDHPRTASCCAASSPASAATATASASPRSAARSPSTPLRRQHPGERLHARRRRGRPLFRARPPASATR